MNLSRRQLVTAGIASAVGLSLSPDLHADTVATNSIPLADRSRGLKISVATYTFHQKPLEPTIAAIKRLDIHYCSIKDAHLKLDTTAEQRKEVAEKFKAAGITPLSCGVVYIPNLEPKMRQAFEYARDAGMPTIVCSPVAEALPGLEPLVKEFDIRLAIHNHGPGDKWPSPHEVMGAIKSLDPRIGLCIDVGHTARAGADPAECMRQYKDRLFDVHMKDLDGTAPKSKPIEVGRGALDIRGMFQALLDIHYPHLVSFEYEKDASDPLPGLAESVGYVRGILSDMQKKD